MKKRKKVNQVRSPPSFQRSPSLDCPPFFLRAKRDDFPDAVSKKKEKNSHRYASVSTPCQETMNAAGVRWHRRVDETSCSSCGAEPARGERRESSRRREEGPADASSPSAREGGGQVVATGGRGGEGIGEMERESERTRALREKKKSEQPLFFLPSLARLFSLTTLPSPFQLFFTAEPLPLLSFSFSSLLSAEERSTKG